MVFGYASKELPTNIAELVASPEQLFCVQHAVLDTGVAAGSSILQIHNPGGISFEVYCDRCLDIGWADAVGIPLAWRSARSDIASTRFEPAGNGWIRTFPGGLLATCGLESTGLPSVSNGIEYGLHDRISHIPAENVTYSYQENDVGLGIIVIEGDAIQTALGRGSLMLHRRIVADTTCARITIQDTVKNASFKTLGHMMRHHINLGYPVVRADSVVTSDATPIGMRDNDEGSKELLRFPMVLDIKSMSPEVVYYCKTDERKYCITKVTNTDGYWVSVAQKADSWPLLVLWRNAEIGENVLGVEPSTSKDGGRFQAEKEGEIIWLSAGEERKYETIIEAGHNIMG
jgi:hypothetical protein